MRKNRNKTPEGKLVMHPRWQGGTVTNDSLVLQKKGIESPSLQAVYATAVHRNRKTQYFFRSPERLKAWKKLPDIKSREYEIKVLSSEFSVLSCSKTNCEL